MASPNPAVELRQLAAHAARREQLLRALVALPTDPAAELATLTDPITRAIAATRALTAGEQLRAIRNHDIHQLARSTNDGHGPGGAAIGRRVHLSRSRIDQLLSLDPPTLPTNPASPAVAAVLALDDPHLRIDAACMALEDHHQREAELIKLQRDAARQAIIDGHITQTDLAARLGKHPTWVSKAVGLPDAAKHGRGRTAPTAPDRRRHG